MGRQSQDKGEEAKNDLLALMTHDFPIPLKLLHQVYGSRSTWFQRRKRGLRTFWTEGVGLTVKTADLREFLWKETKDVPPPEAGKRQDRYRTRVGRGATK